MSPQAERRRQSSYRRGMAAHRRGIGQCCRAGRIVKAEQQNALCCARRTLTLPCRSTQGGSRVPASTALDPDYVLWSAPATQRADRPLIVLLHGWSYDERHLFAFAHLFPQEMVVASVRAPYAEAGGHARVPSRGNPIGNPQPRVANDATEAVLDWLNTLPPASSIGLLGFSQGGAMALQLMRRAPARFDYGVQLA